MIRTFKDANGAGRSIVVPSAEAADYGARGFQPAAYGKVDITAFRDEASTYKPISAALRLRPVNKNSGGLLVRLLGGPINVGSKTGVN
jgi:hypothetical protein